MSLNSLLQRKGLLVLGLNSGTSADAVDLALLRITRSAHGVTIRFIDGAERKFPTTLRRHILAAAGEQEIAYDALLALDTLLGEFFARAASAFLANQPRQHRTVHLIASHGQTIQHRPKSIRLGSRKTSGSLQLGSLDHIAAHTGCVTIGDFRQGDIATGGEGAPITTPAMASLFGDSAESRLIVNIGGIANFFYLPAGKKIDRADAADCGPGNMLIDACTNTLLNQKYDRNGAIARSGTASDSLLRQLMNHPFLRSKSRKSTGREEFGAALVAHILAAAKKLRLSKADTIATVSELTARAIGRGVQPILRRDKRIAKLYLTGGGAHNKFLRNRLSTQLPDLAIDTIDSLGIPAGLVEAASFAVLGEACLRGEAMPTRKRINNKRTTRPILGHVVQPPVSSR